MNDRLTSTPVIAAAWGFGWLMKLLAMMVRYQSEMAALATFLGLLLTLFGIFAAIVRGLRGLKRWIDTRRQKVSP